MEQGHLIQGNTRTKERSLEMKGIWKRLINVKEQRTLKIKVFILGNKEKCSFLRRTKEQVPPGKASCITLFCERDPHLSAAGSMSD